MILSDELAALSDKELSERISALTDTQLEEALEIAEDLAGYRLVGADLRATLQPKQELAEELSGQCDALLYGGSAGSGKTFWLLLHVTKQMLDYPGNRGVIFRRVFPSLNRTIIPRARVLLRSWATENKNEHIFTFRNGSILELATLQYEDSVDNYQGAEYGVVAFEEITEFLESQVDYFKVRLRAPVQGPHPHLIGTTNPGGVGHKWTKREWVRPELDDVVGGEAKPFQVWSARPKGVEPPMTRCYVPATLDDNQKLLERDPDYPNRIMAIKDPRKRKAYREGDWDAIEEVEGALWKQATLDGGRVYSVPDAINRRIIAIDPADGSDGKTNDGYGVTVACLGEDGKAYVEWNDEWHNSPLEMATATIELYKDWRAGLIVIEKNHGGKWIPTLLKKISPSVNVDTVWASEAKRTRAEPIAAFFEEQKELGYPRLAHLVGVYPELEEELTHYTGKPGEPSPDRLDSMVWALTELLGDIVVDYDIPAHSTQSITGDLMGMRW